MRNAATSHEDAVFYCVRVSGGVMSKKDAVLVASRTLAFLFVIWAVAEVTYLPEFLQANLYYATAAERVASIRRILAALSPAQDLFPDHEDHRLLPGGAMVI
jgi:hypothetical protein